MDRHVSGMELYLLLIPESAQKRVEAFAVVQSGVGHDVTQLEDLIEAIIWLLELRGDVYPWRKAAFRISDACSGFRSASFTRNATRSLSFNFPKSTCFDTLCSPFAPCFLQRRFVAFLFHQAHKTTLPSGLSASSQRSVTLSQESARMFPTLVILDIKVHSYL